MGDPGWIAVGAPPARCPIYVHPGFMADRDCDVLLELAQRQQRGGALGLGCRPGDARLSGEENAALERFEAKVAAATSCDLHPDDGRAVFKLCAADTDGLDGDSSDDADPAQQAVRCADLPLGLHVDTHSKQSRRFASVIL